MLELLLRMYAGYMIYGTTGLLPHMVGPPGSGKSTVAQDLADLLGVKLHIISVNRLSPLEVEGVQMPHGSEEDMILRMLPATYWTRLKEGDIVLFDEFLIGFQDVYNALLDVFTSRRVGEYELPKVFMIAASNTVAIDSAALKDRIMHLPVADPRKRKGERQRLTEMLVSQLGLLPDAKDLVEMQYLMDEVVLPMFDVLDQLNLKSKQVGSKSREGKSIRNLIAQVQLRHVQSTPLRNLIEVNNSLAMAQNKAQYVILLSGKAPHGYEKDARRLVGNPHLTPVQAKNLEMNLQLIDLAYARKEKVDEWPEDH